MRMRMILTSVMLALWAGSAGAEVKTKTVMYSFDGTMLKGYLAWDDAKPGKRPGVLVVHEWWGLNEYAKKRAEQLAGLGYVALAADMFGEGKTTEHPKEAAEMAGTVRKNLKAWHGRAEAALKVLKDNEHVDPDRIAAIGYCFGGSTALELAHTGAPLSAVVSFHGALPVPTPEQAKSIKAKILICHGADDSFIPGEVIRKVRAAYDQAKVDYQFNAYPGAVHSFTVPDADSKKLKGIAYNAEADRRSWSEMQALFRQAFAK